MTNKAQLIVDSLSACARSLWSDSSVNFISSYAQENDGRVPGEICFYFDTSTEKLVLVAEDKKERVGKDFVYIKKIRIDTNSITVDAKALYFKSILSTLIHNMPGTAVLIQVAAGDACGVSEAVKVLERACQSFFNENPAAIRNVRHSPYQIRVC